MILRINKGLVIAGLAIVLGALQWQTLLFFQDGASLHRMTRILASANTTTTCPKNPHSSRNDTCSLLPADATASFVWNQGFADRIRTNHPDDDSVLSFLNAYRLLRGVRQLPSHTAWSSLWKNHHLNNSRPLQLWIFVNPLDVKQPSDCSKEKQSSCPPTWLQLLHETAAQYCHLIDMEWTIFDWSFATTEFYTRLLTAQRGKTHGPDIIVHALSRHDLKHANMERKDPHSVLWEEERRRVLQDFVRAGRRSNACGETVILFVDDFVSTTSTSSRSMWVEQVNSRMLHQISEYYSTGLISFNQIVMELLHSLKATTSNDYSVLAPDDSGRYEATAHKALAQTILYGLLHFVITDCNTRDEATASLDAESLIPLDIANRVRTVMPPFLDSEQTLLTVSGEWSLQEQTEQQFHEKYCRSVDAEIPSTCFADFYVDQPLSTLGNGERPDGWTLSSEGKLQFSESANLRWSLSEEAKLGLEGGRLTVFILLPDKEGVQLNWTISSQDSSTMGSLSSQSLQDGSRSTSSGGSSSVAIQMVVQLPDRVGDDLAFHLERSPAESVVEIVGLFLCQEETIKRITS